MTAITEWNAPSHIPSETAAAILDCSQAFDESFLPEPFSAMKEYPLDDLITPEYSERPSELSPLGSVPVFSSRNNSIMGDGIQGQRRRRQQQQQQQQQEQQHQQHNVPPQPLFPQSPDLNSWQRSARKSYSTSDMPESSYSQYPSFCAGDTVQSFIFSDSTARSPETAHSPPFGNGVVPDLETRCSTPVTDEGTTNSSPNSLKRYSPRTGPENPDPAPKRKRGRPRLRRNEPEMNDQGDEGNGLKVSRRLPHNQVERKYREGLNSELDRLRRAIPTLPQRDTNDLPSPPKPSKATVLASAVDYIKLMECERDQLLDEIERLRNLECSRGSGCHCISSGMQIVGCKEGERS